MRARGLRLLAIDLGEKRTGIATGDTETRFVAPLVVLDFPRGPLLDEALDRLIREHAPDRIVIGLPLNMDDTEGPAAAAARRAGEGLASRTGRMVVFHDERLTSFAAEKHLDRSGRTRDEKKRLRDALAAAELLRDYLAQERGDG